MAELGFVSEAEAAAARAVPMHASPHERPIEVQAPSVAEMVRREMIARYGGDVLTRGYHVTTTIDPTLPAAATTPTPKGPAPSDPHPTVNQHTPHTVPRKHTNATPTPPRTSARSRCRRPTWPKWCGGR